MHDAMICTVITMLMTISATKDNNVIQTIDILVTGTLTVRRERLSQGVLQDRLYTNC